MRALSQLIACDIHPLNNLRVLQYLEKVLGVNAAARTAWYQHWVKTGFDALERMLAMEAHAGAFCAGESPGMAGCCLVPQMYNARRFRVPLEAYPQMCRIEASCLEMDAFQKAAPGEQVES